jgi:hypothetical protein
MKLIDYVYAHIYSWYYKMARNGRKVNPQSLTAIAFSICINGWFVFSLEIYFHFSNHPQIKINALIYIILALISGGIVNEIYSRKDRYLAVYNKYAASRQIKNIKNPILFSWIFILLPYVLLLLFLIPII